jgi:hypothetical protein
MSESTIRCEKKSCKILGMGGQQKNDDAPFELKLHLSPKEFAEMQKMAEGVLAG